LPIDGSPLSAFAKATARHVVGMTLKSAENKEGFRFREKDADVKVASPRFLPSLAGGLSLFFFCKMNIFRFHHLAVLFALAAMLAACGSTPEKGHLGRGEAIYKVGQPYQIKGSWYYPKEDYSYDETGIASWYGDDFHDQKTANGEIYNKNELTAAHKTLPMPSLARVTNLENGRSIVVRINDRGPFSGARIIDVSQRSAQLLGFENKGTAMVRVSVLADESKAIADAMRRYGSETEVAQAQQPSAPIQPAVLTPAPVAVKNIEPVITTPETHRELVETRPVPVVVQLPVSGNNRLYVQAGAFTVPENAQKLKQSLSRLAPTTISTVFVNGKQFYRVRLGPVPDVEHADELLNKVRQAGVANARTVVD